jgi:hypothetical protein
MPVNAVLIRALLQFYLYYGDNFKMTVIPGSGKLMNLFEVAHDTRPFLMALQPGPSPGINSAPT